MPSRTRDRGPRWARLACGIRQRTIARALGVRQSTIARWENGLTRPTGAVGKKYWRVIAGLARHLEVREKPGSSCPLKWGACGMLGEGRHECAGQLAHAGGHACAWCAKPKN